MQITTKKKLVRKCKAKQRKKLTSLRAYMNIAKVVHVPCKNITINFSATMTYWFWYVMQWRTRAIKVPN